MANENETKIIEREFYYLDSGDLTYKKVLAHSRQQHGEGMWYLPTEQCSVREGAQIFGSLLDMYKAAETVLAQQERRFKAIKLNFKKIEDDVNF